MPPVTNQRNIPQAAKREFRPVRLSLEDLLGAEYVGAVCEARAALTGCNLETMRRLGGRKINFYPRRLQRALAARLPDVGNQVASPLPETAPGATTAAFQTATDLGAAPLTGWGYYRLGEDGRLYLTTKSEHYHVPLGHTFPGYRLVDFARRMGLPNATHNNTRGYVTRLLERRLLEAVNVPGDGASAGDLDCVLNLETGSLGVEAGLKMMLARFYRVQAGNPTAPRAGTTPVFGVIGDTDGGLTANYHGTTILTQTMRGMWPDLTGQLANSGLMKVVPVRPNRVEDLETLFARHGRGPDQLAGFLHELVLMNYGGLKLQTGFVRRLYELCERHEVPTLCDEIQTCLWAPQLFLSREYGIRPTFIVVGKGFPGGEYAASRILFNSDIDTLPQFGALVTNGQEELASLSYLVTMAWAQANVEITRAIGEYYRRGLEDLAESCADVIESIEGQGHLAAIFFRDVSTAQTFAKAVAGGGLDISVQTYKPACPPAALTKLPLIADVAMVDFVLQRFRHAVENTG